MTINDFLKDVPSTDPSVSLFRTSLEYVREKANGDLSVYVRENGNSFLVNRSNAAEFSDMMFAITDLYDRMDGAGFLAAKSDEDIPDSCFWKLLNSICLSTRKRKQELAFLTEKTEAQYKQVVDHLFTRYIQFSKNVRPELDMTKDQVEAAIRLLKHAHSSIITNNEYYDDYLINMRTRFGLAEDKCGYIWIKFNEHKQELQQVMVVDIINDFFTMLSSSAEVSDDEDDE